MAWGNGDKFAWWLYNGTHIKQQCSPPHIHSLIKLEKLNYSTYIKISVEWKWYVWYSFFSQSVKTFSYLKTYPSRLFVSKLTFPGINANLINLMSKICFTLRNTLGYSKTIEHGPPHQITDGITRLSLT